MIRHIIMGLMVTFAVIAPTASSAQYLQVVGQDQMGNPLCTGPRGIAPCIVVQNYMAANGMLGGAATPPPPAMPPLFQIGVDASGTPICAGPLGPASCVVIANFLQNRFGQAPPIQRQDGPELVSIGTDASGGAICLGPLGPGPCGAIRSYLARLKAPTPSVVADPGSVTVKSSEVPGVFATCDGSAGEQPCSILQQELVDSGREATVDTLSDAESLTLKQLAQRCAEQTGIDVVNFAACTGKEMILTERQKEIVDCASTSERTEDFAKCSAASMGFKLDQREQRLVDCARKGSGTDEFLSCAGDAVLSSDATATLECYKDADGDSEAFARCAGKELLGKVLNDNQREAVECIAQAGGAADIALCAADQAGLSEQEQTVLHCAVESSGNASDFVGCAGTEVVSKYVGRDAATAMQCGIDESDATGFATCAATGILGEKASREQKIALRCAADSGGDVEQAAVCAGANMLNMQLGLNPEQQIAVQCLVSSGGQPYAAAGCIATRLTARELTKCFTDGVGGDGCFGDNNDLVGKNGWTARTLKDLAGGPNSVINNPDQIWGGSNSFVRNPGQIWGGDNSFVKNPSQIWGGPNSVFNNPGQLAPKPIEAKIGNTRICIPWC